MKFLELATLFEKLEKTSSYLALQKILSEFFKKTPKQEIEHVAYFCLGQIASEFADINIGMAEKMVLRSIGVEAKTYKQIGDLGKTAEQYAKGKGTLSVKTVFDTLHAIAKTTGAGSQEKKIRLLNDLLKNASPIEARYIARIVVGDLRLGVGSKTILDALSIAYTGTKEKRKELEYAYNICPDVGVVAKTLAYKGIKRVRDIEIELGIPLQSMLCQRIKNLVDVDKKMGYPVTVEEKYDGERIQVHKKGMDVKLYSRRLDDITAQFPDIVAAVKKAVKAKNCVLDSEVMPVDKKGNLLPFQVLMQRRRKYEVEAYVKKIPVILFVFDVLYYKKSLINEQYKKRYSILTKILKETKTVKLAMQKICQKVDCVEELFNKVVEHGGEGVIIKNLQGPYQAGIRGWHWIKWKPEYVKGMRDTFDLVVVGAYYGKGRRAGTYGALLCAVYDKKNDVFETVCKVGSGFTDKTLGELPKKFKTVAKKPARVQVKKIMKPDVWIAPQKVIEVIGSEITKSPSHTSGYALRFPRFLRWRDKKPEQATTKKEIQRFRKL